MRLISLVGLLFALLLSACGAEAGDDAAMSLEEPQVAQRSFAAVVTCPDPKSCGSWSTWYNIGSPYCQTGVPGCGAEICKPCNCTLDGCDLCCRPGAGPATYQTQESFRDCRLQNGKLCREKREQTVFLGCGC